MPRFQAGKIATLVRLQDIEKDIDQILKLLAMTRDDRNWVTRYFVDGRFTEATAADHLTSLLTNLGSAIERLGHAYGDLRLNTLEQRLQVAFGASHRYAAQKDDVTQEPESVEGAKLLADAQELKDMVGVDIDKSESLYFNLKTLDDLMKGEIAGTDPKFKRRLNEKVVSRIDKLVESFDYHGPADSPELAALFALSDITGVRYFREIENHLAILNFIDAHELHDELLSCARVAAYTLAKATVEPFNKVIRQPKPPLIIGVARRESEDKRNAITVLITFENMSQDSSLVALVEIFKALSSIGAIKSKPAFQAVAAPIVEPFEQQHLGRFR